MIPSCFFNVGLKPNYYPVFIPALKRGATDCQRFIVTPPFMAGLKATHILDFSPNLRQQLETVIEPYFFYFNKSSIKN